MDHPFVDMSAFVAFPSVSQFIRTIGPLQVHVDRATQQLTFALNISAIHSNAAATCHGGVIATLLDAAMAATAIHQVCPDRITPTVSLTCNYSHGSSVGETLVARSRVDDNTSSHVFTSCVIHSGTKTVATGSAIFLVPKSATPGFNFRELISALAGC